jgi:hypothetical protein
MEEGNKFLSSKNAFKIFVGLVLLNLLFLDCILVNGQKTQEVEKIVPTPTISKVCPESCLSEISSATKSVALLSVKPTSVLLPSPAGPAFPTQIQLSVKEFFVPFGIGSNSSDDWQDISGLNATLNPANYGSIKSVVFEVTIRIPAGNEIAYVRLYNATDKHPVWFSDVSLEGGSPQLLISKSITLDSGNKIYQVQMKTSLRSPAYLDQSRLHIVTN